VMAKLIIRLIHTVGAAIDREPRAKEKLRVVFLPDYGVSLAETLIPAADLSEQISTAGTEASGTGNMKFALNGALTIGTSDGATIEMAEKIGTENLFLFGLSASEVDTLNRGGRNSGREAYDSDSGIRATMDFLFSSRFENGEAGAFAPIRDALMGRPDPYAHLADFNAYVTAQEQVDTLWRTPDAWTRKAMLNVARMGYFSSDRAIREYAGRIWGIEPVTYGGDGP